MKLTRFTPTSCPAQAPRERGFALLVTIVLVAFLVLILVGLATFTRVETQVASNSQQLAQARQNALMALNIAVGELQKNLGPDKRTSANAELVRSTFDTPANRAGKNPYWVGAWNTEGGFRGWLVSGNENLTQTGNLSADVSSVPFNPLDLVTPAYTSPTASYTITTTSGTDAAIPLVGPNTVGTDLTANQRYVFAPLRAIQVPAATIPGLGSASGNTTIGRYAWWVGDEGVKANLASPVAPLPASTPADRLKFLAGAPNRGFPTLGSSTPWERWSPEFTGAGAITDFTATQSKLLTRKQLPFISAGLTDEEKARFHEFTTVSAGVLSDSKNGGLRKDLSIAFEIPETSFVNSEFTRVLTAGEQPNAFATNHEDAGNVFRIPNTVAGSPNPFNARSTKTAINYRDPNWASGLVYRGPTFDQLRDHYQLYRRFNSNAPFTADASINAQLFQPNAPYTSNTHFSQRAPWGDYFGASSEMPATNATGTNYQMEDSYSGTTPITRLRPITTEMAPEIMRYSYVMALQSYRVDTDIADHSRIRLIINPYITLYNPYNVVLKTPPIWLRITRAEVAINIPSAPANNSDPANPIPARASADISLMYFTDSITGAYTGNLSGANGNAYQSVDHFLSDNGNPNPSGSNPGSITLQPGEIKVYTITGSNPVDIETQFTSSTRNMFFQALDINDPAQLFSTGVYKTLKKQDGTPYLIYDNVNFTFTVTNTKYIQGGSDPAVPGLGDSSNESFIIFSKFIASYSGVPVANMDANWPSVRRTQMFNGAYWQGTPANNAAHSLRTGACAGNINAPGGGARYYVAQTDVYWKPSNDGANRDNNFSLITHNPRAMVQTGMAAGGQGPNSTRGPANWTGSAENLGNSFGGGAPNLNIRFWGTGTTPAAGGKANVVLWDIPRAPLTAIAAFQNANLSRLCTAPAYAVGNSYASPYMAADQIWRRSGLIPGSATGAINERYWNLDDSYIFNEALFDSYFFSGVNPGLNAGGNAWNNPLANSSVFPGATTLTADQVGTPLKTQLDDWRLGTAAPANPLLNPRLKFTLPTGRTTANATTELDVTTAYAAAQTKLNAATDIRPHNAIAAYLLAQGSFNVNSVSIDAWRTLLAGLRGAAVDHFSSPTNLGTDSSTTKTSFPRASLPGASSTTGTDEKLWNGFRSLTDTQLNTLATEIVAEIKDRARIRPASALPRPFTTLGEFINRRLVTIKPPFPRPLPALSSTEKYSLSGILQAAIDRTTVNDSLSGQTVIPASTTFITQKRTPADLRSSDYDNPYALAAATIAGAPQWFSQADLLQRIGPQLSARSDTFTVRTYGESVNPVTGEVQGRAWLEAVVQRETAYVNSDDHPALPITVLTAQENKDFGRRFRVVSMRWLSPDDI